MIQESENDKENMSQSIEDRFRELWSVAGVHEASFDPVEQAQKSASESIRYRELGNQAYKKKGLSSALDFYNKSILFAPHPSAEKAGTTDVEGISNNNRNDHLLALAYGNRSALFYIIQHYQQSLADIDRALRHNYPIDKQWKLFQRKARCYEAMGDIRKAVVSARVAAAKCDVNGNAVATSADRAQLATYQSELSEKMDNESVRKPDCTSNFDDTERDPWRPVPPLAGAPCPDFPSLSRVVRMVENRERGRHFVAGRDMDPGEVVVVERPFAFCLNADRLRTHCSNCARRCSAAAAKEAAAASEAAATAETAFAPVPCPTCTLVVFCSDECQREAMSTFHQCECSILPRLEEITAYIRKQAKLLGKEYNDYRPMLHLPLRILLRAGAKVLHQHFVEQSGRVSQQCASVSRRNASAGKVHSDSFASVLSLIPKETGVQFSTADLFNLVVVLKELKATSFFDEIYSELEKEKRTNGSNGMEQATNAAPVCVGISMASLSVGDERQRENRQNLSSDRVKSPASTAGINIGQFNLNDESKPFSTAMLNFDVFVGCVLYTLHQVCQLNCYEIEEYEAENEDIVEERTVCDDDEYTEENDPIEQESAKSNCSEGDELGSKSSRAAETIMFAKDSDDGDNLGEQDSAIDNCSEGSEVTKAPWRLTHTLRRIAIGTALNVLGSLFNHSCFPNATRNVHGTTAVFRTLRSLRAGDELTISYGCDYSADDRLSRQQLLRDQYQFNCDCPPCSENWPTAFNGDCNDGGSEKNHTAADQRSPKNVSDSPSTQTGDDNSCLSNNDHYQETSHDRATISSVSTTHGGGGRRAPLRLPCPDCGSVIAFGECVCPVCGVDQTRHLFQRASDYHASLDKMLEARQNYDRTGQGLDRLLRTAIVHMTNVERSFLPPHNEYVALMQLIEHCFNSQATCYQDATD